MNEPLIPDFNTPSPEMSSTIQETIIETQTLTPEPEEMEINHVLPEYSLKVKFDYSNQSALVDETINYVNNSKQILNDIRLATDTLRYPGSFSIENVYINSTENVLEQGKYFFSVRLNEGLAPGEEIEIQINYLLSIPPLPPPADDRKPGIYGYSTVQTNLVDWYPFIPPLSENGEWLLHDPWFYGEYLVYDLANFYVEIELLNPPSNTTIAASSIPITQVDNHYGYSSSRARNFVWSLSPSYVIETKELNGITISTHSFPFHQQAGSHVLEEATKALELYSKLFSPYPRENLTIVEADFLDGMEYDGLFFLSRGFYNLFDSTPQNYLTAIAVHETAHQWWYASIGNDQALEPWLDEALCTYSEILFFEEYYPKLVDWWWEYRVNYYQPEGYINQSIYEYQGFIPYRNATYLQGAKFLQSLRDELGDKIFFDFLKEYAASQRDKISSQTYFFEILKGYS
ncbi:MAG: hypothetical protein IH585_02455, partial [Anaerolineaceae bacterium]|nr:hypothetical protein [Anaerolineaceae bacterium]